MFSGMCLTITTSLFLGLLLIISSIQKEVGETNEVRSFLANISIMEFG